VRAFYAIGLWDLIDVTSIHRQFSWTREVRWVSPSHVHLTLNFLGEITSMQAHSATTILRKTAKTNQPFALEWDRTGVFPSWHRPQVLWVGLKEESQRVVSGISESLGNANSKPHLTIGRLRRQPSANLITQWKDYQILWPSILVTKLLLVKSTLTKQGPIYEVSEECHLGN
jgi:2'-5' RNA ligase